MLKLFYNTADHNGPISRSVIDEFLTDSSIPHRHCAQSRSITFQSTIERDFHQIIYSFNLAINKKILTGIFFTTHPEIELLDSDFIQGIIASSELSSMYVTAGTWKTLGILPTKSKTVEIASLSYIQQNKTQYLRRELYYDQIDHFLNSEQLTTLLVSASSGMGKTTLIKNYLEDKNHLFISFKDTTQATMQWWNSFSKINLKGEHHQHERILSSIISYLNDSQEQQILVFDDYQWCDLFSKILITGLSKNIPQPHKLILLARNELTDEDQLSHDLKIRIKPFSTNEIELLLLKNYPTHAESCIKTASEQIKNVSTGHPLLTIEAANYLINYENFDQISNHSTIVALIANLIKSTSLINTAIDSDHFILLRIVAEFEYQFTKADIHLLLSTLKLKTNTEELTSLPFIQSSSIGYHFSHDLYRQAILSMSPLRKANTVYALLAKSASKRKQFKQASVFWEQAKREHRAYICKLHALHQSHLDNAPSSALALIDDIASGLNHYRISDTKRIDITWKIAQTEHFTGTLEKATRHYSNFIKSYKLRAKKRHFPLALYYYFFPKSRLFSPTHLTQENCDKITTAATCIVDFNSFHSSPADVVKYIILSHRVSLLDSPHSEYKGFSYLQLALCLYPLFKEKCSKKMIPLARAEMNNQKENRLNFSFMETFLHMYTTDWHKTLTEIDNNIETAFLTQNYKPLALIGTLKTIIHMDLGEPEKALDFINKEIKSVSAYLPVWFLNLYQQIRYGLYLELFHPSKVLFLERDTIPLEIRGGAHLYYAGAEAYLGNYEKSYQHIEQVLKYFDQMQYLNQAFTICIKPFVETPLILYNQGHLDKKKFNKFMRCARRHGKTIARSKPLILGYDGIFNILHGKENKGIKMLRQACEDAVKLKNFSALRLFKLHLFYLFGEEITLNSKPTTGELTRVIAIWKSSVHQAHPEFLCIL